MSRLILRNPSVVPPGRFHYRQRETDQTFEAGTLPQLADKVRAHRNTHSIPIGTDFLEEIQDYMCKGMPDMHVHCVDPKNPGSPHVAASRTTGWKATKGPQMWAELHRYALTQKPTQGQRAAWLVNFASKIDCGECAREWKRLNIDTPLAKNAKPNEFFEWTVTVHNKVNQRLGKPVISMQDAKNIWG